MEKKVILYGAGSDVNKMIGLLKERGIEPLCICDGNSGKWGALNIGGITIIPPYEIGQYDSKTIIISASFFDSIYDTIHNVLGGEVEKYKIYAGSFIWFMLVNVELNETLLENGYQFMDKHEASIRSVYDTGDAITAEILDYIIKMRKSKDFFCEYSSTRGMQFVEGYFYMDEIDKDTPKTIIDIGAYVGDTMEEFMGRWKESVCNYYAYEPSESNYNILNINVEKKGYKDKVHTFRKALGDKKRIVSFGKKTSAFGIMDKEAGEFESIEIDKLDNEKLCVQGTLIIKMDVEGLEMGVLKGAVDVIKTYRPYMAICVYHRIEDIYSVPVFLNSIGGRYRYLLRSGVHTHLVAIPEKSS